MTECNEIFWKEIESAPKDGTIIAGAEFYRWRKYKPGSTKGQLARGGRWQRWSGFGWENAEPPQMWTEVHGNNISED